MNDQKRIKKNSYLNYQILIPYFILLLLGCLFVYSASSDILLLNHLKTTAYLFKQIVYDLFAIFVLYVTYRVKLQLFRSKKFVKAMILLSLALLFYLVLLRIVKGSAAAVNGAVGWINLGPINIQPVEIAKLSLTIYLAFLVDKRIDKINQLKILEAWSNPLVIVILMLFMTLLQPDIGGAAILGMVTLILFTTSGIPVRLALTLILITVFGVITLLFIAGTINPDLFPHSYQIQRFLAFAHPFKLEKTSGAQLVNSYYAIHNGGLFGVGIGNSMQKQGYLPEPYTDFILSIIAEEIGVLGAIIIISLIFFIIWKTLEIATSATNQFNALICFGVATMLFTETLFNVGALLGLLPITGVTLPFISYGGSSVIVLSFGLGLVLNISAYEQIKKDREAQKL
ncbi:MAG: FtsW/RodA/SpoVE family cell cycle protein [Lactobacillus sp.]|nr:FtsW/RodA/SpoVE family cell cycle protein [Lactobacillus sp.]